MTWKDITIKKYISICTALDATYKDEEEKVFALLSILHDKPTAYFEGSISVAELSRLIREMQFIYSKTHIKGIPSSLRIGKDRYIIEREPSKLISGQYIDLSSYCKDEKTINRNYHNIIATLLSPVDFYGNRFNRMIRKAKTQDELELVHTRIFEERQEIAKKLFDILTMDKVFQISDYFFLLWQNLTNSILDSLEAEKAKAMKNLNQVLQEEGFGDIGDGI